MPSKVLLNGDEMRRALVRMAHEIVEQNGGVEDLVLVGLATRGVPLAQRIQHAIKQFELADVACGQLDPTLYRDDLFTGRPHPLHATTLPSDVTAANIVVVDDVLFTGRTVRAALDALMDHGRPRTIKLAVLVDRGHRELPIRADFVGKNVPTSHEEKVEVRVVEIDGEDEVLITGAAGEQPDIHRMMAHGD